MAQISKKKKKKINQANQNINSGVNEVPESGNFSFPVVFGNRI